ncbi:protein kinase, partial [Myxococcota bacterium]|nr:protein kinase [Myxococcota bacterium]
MADLPRAFGPYLLLKQLGVSSTSDVYLAQPLDPAAHLPAPLVIKRLHPELTPDDELYDRFTHEARIAVEARSPHLPQIYDVGRVGDSVYIAMEYLTGWTVARLITDLQGAGRQATISSAVDVVAGGLEALEVLHGARDRETGEPLGIVHRDLAPKNVMLGEDGLTRLIDFGLGKSRMQDWKTETGVVLGTPGYMAPEQVTGGSVDQRTDLYAMGIVLWELLTLRTYVRRGPVPLMLRAQASPVFTPPSRVRDDVPAALDEVLRVALAPDPAARFPTARHFLDALRRAVPRRDEESPLPTLVGEMLWGELEHEKSEVTQLVTRTAPAPMIAPGAAPMPALGAPATPLIDGPSAGARPASLPRTGPVPGTIATASPPSFTEPLLFEPMPRPAAGVPVRAVVAMLVATLALGVGVGVIVSVRRAEPVAEVRPEPAQPAPSAVPSARVEEPSARAR